MINTKKKIQFIIATTKISKKKCLSVEVIKRKL